MDHNQMVKREFTRQAVNFAASAVVADSRLADRMVAFAQPTARTTVLDVACGPGIISAALAKTAKAVMGFDLTEAMLDKARERCTAAGLTNVEFRRGDAADLPFADGSFDCAVTRLSIHHFPDPLAVLNEIHRVVREGGTLVVCDVLSSGDPAASELHNAIEILRDPSHVRMLPVGELRSLIAESGFEIEAETSWITDREFDEWAKIASEPRRGAALRVLLAALIRAGETAGINLSGDGDRISFVHSWHQIRARRTQ